ncbi:MAG: metallophosphoesterase family protein [Candidatus Bilamarchaeum sp.]|jgi:putative SbcD/Mre11-related phosphoesterase
MKFIYNAPAILHKDALIIGDTHFGMENKLRERGVYDRAFTMRLVESIVELIKEHKAKKLILLGDVKENILTLDLQTKHALEKLSKHAQITVIRGNHDGGIESSNCIEVVPSDGLAYHDLGLIHGHSWPKEEVMECSYLVMGHQHPLISIKDSLGKSHVEPAWIMADIDVENTKKHYKKFNKKMKLILMPAYNPLLGTTIKFTKNDQLGPILNNKLFKLEETKVIRLNGTNLGTIRNTE